MDDENNSGDSKPMKINSGDLSNDLSINLASLLKNLSQNSVSICETPVTSISDLNLEIENFDQNIHRNKTEVEDFGEVKSESFLNQLASNDRIHNIDYINGKRNKSQYDTTDINKSIQNVKLISKLTNTRFSSNIDALNSMQMQNISAIKSLLDNQNGQVYLLVKSDAVQAIDSSNNFTNLLHSTNYSQPVQFSPEIGIEMASSDNCTTNLNNSTLMLAAHQLQISNNLSTAELIQKILESPQTTNSNNHLDSIITNRKIDESSISSLVQTFRDSIHTDNISNQYYECSIDSNNETEITLLVDDDNSVSNSQFPQTSQSIKQEKQILILKGNSEMESMPINTRIVGESMKDHLFSNQNNTLEINGELYNEVSNTFNQSNLGNSSIAMKKGHAQNKGQKRLKIKPAKLNETSGQSDSSSKAYSSNSPIFSMSLSQIDHSPNKEYINGDGEFKELKRKSSHNEVERRRRDRINTWISELQNMLPNNEKMTLNRSKSHILKAVYDYFRVQTDQFNEIQVKYEKLTNENREKTVIIKKLEAEKEVLLSQLQYINQAVTNTVKSTEESLNRNNMNHYRVNSIEKIKVGQPYRITSVYSNDVNNFSNSYIIDNQNKKRKLTETESIKKL